MGEKISPDLVSGFSALQGTLSRIENELQEMNKREALREIDRLRDLSPSGEFVPEGLVSMTTPRAALVLAAGVSALVIPPKPGRLYAVITNGGANPANLSGMDPAVAGQGPWILPGGVLEIGRKTDLDIRAGIWAVSALGTTLMFWES
jgi:hypothetical protein